VKVALGRTSTPIVGEGVTTLKFFWAEDEKARALKSISPINQPEIRSKDL
jgi:hypothetical protein